jgi:hypothetical protein
MLSRSLIASRPARRQVGCGLAEDEPERVEHEIGAEPHVLAALRLDNAAEHIGVTGPEHAVHAVGRHHEVTRDRRRIVDLHAELELDAELLAAALQDAEQLLAGDRREGVAARAQEPSPVADVDGVPPRERVGDLDVGLQVRLAQLAERLAGEHHAPAERRVGRIAFHDADLMTRIPLLQQDAEVQPGRTGTDDRDLHVSVILRSPWPADRPRRCRRRWVGG